MHSPTSTHRRAADPLPPTVDTDDRDRERFAALYARHRDELARYCRSILRHDQDVEDALQSTMTKAFAALRTETREIALRPWLFRIAHNEAITIVRRRIDPVELDDRDGGDPDVVPQAVETRERLRLLRDDLRDLPDRQRSALVLRELNGLGHREIADVLGSSPAVVKQAIYEARCGLGDCAAGRSLACDRVRRALSDGDGRTAGRRRLRAHLRSCGSCRAFDAALRQRPRDLGALFPVWPAVGAGGAASGLAGLLSGGGAVVGAGSATVAAGVSGAGGGLLGGGFLAATGAAKIAGIAAVAVVAGGGAVAVERGTFAGSGSEPLQAPARDAAATGSPLTRFAAADGAPLVLPAVATASTPGPKPAAGGAPSGRSARGNGSLGGEPPGSSDRRSRAHGSAVRSAADPAPGERPGRALGRDRGQAHPYGRPRTGPPSHAANGSANGTPSRGRDAADPGSRPSGKGPASAAGKRHSDATVATTPSGASPAHAGVPAPPSHAASSRPAQAGSPATAASENDASSSGKPASSVGTSPADGPPAD